MTGWLEWVEPCEECGNGPFDGATLVRYGGSHFRLMKGTWNTTVCEGSGGRRVRVEPTTPNYQAAVGLYPGVCPECFGPDDEIPKYVDAALDGLLVVNPGDTK